MNKVCEPSARQVIAKSAIATAELCSCGIVHLHLGAITLRLDPSAVAELSSVLAICEQAAADPDRLHMPYFHNRARPLA